MTKQELVTACAEKTHDSKVNAERHINAILETITDELASGGSVKLLGFGKFEVRQRKSRIGRNPQSPSETVFVPPVKGVKFSPGQRLKDAVNK